MESYYVVKRGHTPGIYKTWAECKAAVDGFKSPIFKKFSSFDEANAFFKSENQVKPTVKTDMVDMVKIKGICENIKSSSYSEELNYNVSKWNMLEDEIYIFTDGSSRKRNTEYNSGVGVYLGYQCTNIKEQYVNKTNNQCELAALDYAFKLIVRYWMELSEIGKTIKIVSDSEYSIKACSLWLNNWKTNNWCTKTGEPVKNRELIESIDESMTRIKHINSKLEGDKKLRVKLIHVNSHQHMPNIQDKIKYSLWFGNYVADALSQNLI
jgi:ribonuclease HI